MTKISCDIIKDMLPLYYDNVCSTDSKEMVDQHLPECAGCRELLDQMNISMTLPLETIKNNKNEGSDLRSVATLWNRSKFIAFTKGLIIATTICGLLVLGYIGLFRWNIINVPTDVVEITDVSQLKDGRIVYHVRMTDGYNVNQANHKLDRDGNFYVSPVRPVIKSKKFADMGLSNTYYTFDIGENNAYQINHGDSIEIQALYLGTPDDPILIWKKGIVLPAASEAIEHQLEVTY
ncbi:hypothetical protein J2T13_002466 [Paenibacillus sp. DS2015]|uniref:zf-HC2 domain-containing protein n=1 Tax=Paenibacillus sp. DS2015 TaxID=3373917 RepID=UPI003D23049D